MVREKSDLWARGKDPLHDRGKKMREGLNPNTTMLIGVKSDTTVKARLV